jgi:hypothetical protein
MGRPQVSAFGIAARFGARCVIGDLFGVGCERSRRDVITNRDIVSPRTLAHVERKRSGVAPI